SAPPAMPGVPLPFVFLLLLLLLAGAPAQPFPRDLVARSTVGLAATAAYPRFGGLRGDNGTARLGLDFQRMLRLNGTLFVAARDHIYAFELGQDKGTLYPERHLTWEPQDRANCAMRGRRQDECHNYIRVLVPRDAETLLACGTNAFSPLCRTYQVSSLAQQGDEVSGQARCPFDAKQSIVALFVDGSLYSATVADFQASDAVIYRSLSPGQAPLRTLKYSSRWLQEPHFVQVLPYGPYVYFFFREVAVELSALGKVLVARVARVCRNDRGGSPRVLERRWTSFLKVRLQCSVPGDTVFYFDVLEAVTPPQTLHGRPAVLALFGTQPNRQGHGDMGTWGRGDRGTGIPGSAVCAFYLADVERSFEGPFAEPRGATWTAVPEDRVPQPRPGCCAGMGPAAGVGTSGDFPDETLVFAKEHPLLHGAVSPAGGRPLFTHTGTRCRDTVASGMGWTRGWDGRGDGMDAGMGWTRGWDGRGDGMDSGMGWTRGWDGLVPGGALGTCKECECARVRSRRSVQRLKDVQGIGSVQGHEGMAGTGMCEGTGTRTAAASPCPRRSCLAARDPYCVWLPSRGCVPFSEELPEGESRGCERDRGVSGGVSDPAGTGLTGDPAGVRHPGPGPEPTVPVPVLVGCVLGAFALGALATGLVATWCQRPAVPKPPPEPPCAPQSPAQPPVPRLYPALPPRPVPGSPEPPGPPPARSPREREPPGPGPPGRAAR
ncbi:SEM6C protein, partial [Poecile atricapillus]|nr:SEM6C protein [Poecile atricapillus]